MGWLAKAYGAIKTFAKKVSDGTKAGAEKIGNACAKVYSKFTGKEKFEQAKRLYDELKQRMERVKRDYGDFVERTTEKINSEVQKINDMKSELNSVHFQRFIRITSRIACWDIVVENLPEQFQYKSVDIDEISDRNQLLLIDFDKNPVKTNLMAVFTFGFWTRKKATESLHKVQEQEKVLEYEKEKLAAEKIRLSRVLESLNNVSTYFKELTKVYSGILDEVEYTINLIANAGHLANPAYSDEKVDCYFFPVEHLKCLMAADKMSRILFEMTTLRYVTLEGEVVKKDEDKLNENAETVLAIAKKLAA